VINVQDSRAAFSKSAQAWGWWRSSATRCAKKSAGVDENPSHGVVA